MKKVFQYFVVTVLIAAFNLSAEAQLQAKIGYNINSPVGSSFKSFIDKTSFRGVNGEVTYALSEQLNIGLGASYNDFYHKYPRQVYTTKDGDISAVVTNSIQVVPVLARVNYSILKSASIKPYVGLGAGMNLVNYNQYLGEFPDSKATIKPAFSGDAGVNIPLGKMKTSGLNIGANFNYLPFNYNGIKNLNNWGVHAGVFFPLR